MLEKLLAFLAVPFTWLDDADERLFWPFLVGAFVLAAVVLLSERRRGPIALLRAMFPRRVWLHPSARVDYWLVVTKPFFRLALILPGYVSALALARWIVFRLDEWRGIPESTWSTTTVRVVYTLTLFVAWDFSRYLLHRLTHEVPALWQIHQVHHSAEVMTPLTVYRTHPIESILFQLRGVLVTGVVTGMFFHLFRTKALQYDLLGVNVLGFVLGTLGANLRHSHVWLRWPRWLEHVFISPAQHQLHHSVDFREANGNYGAWLSIWDWLAGTLRLSTPNRPERFGLPDEELNHAPRSFRSTLVDPLRAMVGRRRAGATQVPATDP